MDKNKYRRRSIRLLAYDYSWPGEYFITICIHQRECILGEVIDGQMILNEFGRYVNKCWEELPLYYDQLTLGEWVVMPNHIHGILIVGAIHESPLHESPLHESPLQSDAMESNSGIIHELSLHKRRKMLLSKIIGRFKMNSGKQINILRNTPGQPAWQRNYYEHIIRDGRAYIRIENYIRNNPLNWVKDKENPVTDDDYGKGDS